MARQWFAEGAQVYEDGTEEFFVDGLQVAENVPPPATAQLGTFDPELRAECWFDATAVPLGWFEYGPFDNSLIGAAAASFADASGTSLGMAAETGTAGGVFNVIGSEVAIAASSGLLDLTVSLQSQLLALAIDFSVGDGTGNLAATVLGLAVDSGVSNALGSLAGSDSAIAISSGAGQLVIDGGGQSLGESLASGGATGAGGLIGQSPGIAIVTGQAVASADASVAGLAIAISYGVGDVASGGTFINLGGSETGVAIASVGGAASGDLSVVITAQAAASGSSTATAQMAAAASGVATATAAGDLAYPIIGQVTAMAVSYSLADLVIGAVAEVLGSSAASAGGTGLADLLAESRAESTAAAGMLAIADGHAETIGLAAAWGSGTASIIADVQGVTFAAAVAYAEAEGILGPPPDAGTGEGDPWWYLADELDDTDRDERLKRAVLSILKEFGPQQTNRLADRLRLSARDLWPILRTMRPEVEYRLADDAWALVEQPAPPAPADLDPIPPVLPPSIAIRIPRLPPVRHRREQLSKPFRSAPLHQPAKQAVDRYARLRRLDEAWLLAESLDDLLLLEQEVLG